MTFLLSALILIGIIIFVHELGHFLLAKLTGVRVLKFSLGFGPKLIGKKYGDTEYLISSLPLGGYVKMLGETPGEELKEEDKLVAYNYQPVWKRFLIVFSGPLFNLVFAFLIFIFIFLSGIPALYPDVGNVTESSPAAKAGLITGDKILEINGRAVDSWDEIINFMDENQGQNLLIKVRRGGNIIELSVTPVRKSGKSIFGEDKELWDIGISPLIYPVVGEVVKGGQAEKAGVEKGDIIANIDGNAIKTWEDMTAIIHGNPGKPLKFKIKRDNHVMEMTIAPVKTPVGDGKEIGLIGIRPSGNDFIKKYSISEAVPLGAKKTWEMSVLTVVSIVKLIQRVIPADTIGGPILIVQMAGEQASRGLLDFILFMAIININLGIINLLPIPILDGGHILFLGIEAISKKPINEKVIAIAQRVGLAIILTIMVFALYNDIIRLVTGKQLF
ncbi:MAG: RIP metalloprotease RseP [Nitrospirae bacterium RBG_13_39_12]|nr:MAG: RIP metalloprotease RseP [Nitrospirae bacterium RBG_13_39_12]